jgi:hypothetical protein
MRRLVEPIAGLLLFGICFASACGGQSGRVRNDNGSAGEIEGGTGGVAGTGLGASTAGGYGGVYPTGGGSAAVPSAGASGAIPIGGTSGTIGTGGATPCPDCPPADYGLIIEGDGEPYEITYNGRINRARAPLACPEQPLRGSVGGCGRGIVFSACEDPDHGPPCIEIDTGSNFAGSEFSGWSALYVDRQSGLRWVGNVTSDVPSPAVPGVSSGTMTLEFVGDLNVHLVITVKYTFCSQLGVLFIPC